MKLTNEQYFMLTSILANLIMTDIQDEDLKLEVEGICGDIQELLEKSGKLSIDQLADTITDIQNDPELDAGLDEEELEEIVSDGSLEDSVVEILEN